METQLDHTTQAMITRMPRTRRLGLAGYILSAMIAFVVLSTIFYYASGFGVPPHTRLGVLTENTKVVLVVKEGSVVEEDWEYVVFPVGQNPPVYWTAGPTDMRPGDRILLASELVPGEYHVRVRHIPTFKIVLSTSVVVA